jgi:hypothetical protein
VDSADSGENVALLVGVSHGLSGLDIDMKNLEDISNNAAFRFKVTKLTEEQGTVSNIADKLGNLSEAAGRAGTLLFYFTGHGNVGLIWPQDDTMKIGQIRRSIEQARAEVGPLARLVMIYDSCHSGSLLDPMRATFPFTKLANEKLQSAQFADAVVREFEPGLSRDNGRSGYWSSLMVIASSREDETSLASAKGSIFTNAFVKAFNEVSANDGTNGDLIAKSQAYTKGHHPVARLVPAELADEKLVR